MRRRSRHQIVLPKAAAIFLVIAALAAAAHAQIPTGGNVFLGYSYSRGNAFTGSPFIAQPTAGSVNMNGWEISAEGKYLPWVGLIADFDWHYGSRDVTPTCGTLRPCRAPLRLSGSRHELLFGPRVSVSVGRYTPFAEFLFGFAHQSDSGSTISNSDTSFATAVGGGVDYKLIKGVAWRGQLDSIHTGLFGSGRNYLRFSTGVVFRF